MATKKSTEEKGNRPTISPTARTSEGWENSEAAKALQRMQANPRIKAIILSAPANACPACQALSGTYPKDQVPPLPFEACSKDQGCRAFYMPVIEELYP